MLYGCKHYEYASQEGYCDSEGSFVLSNERLHRAFLAEVRQANICRDAWIDG